MKGKDRIKNPKYSSSKFEYNDGDNFTDTFYCVFAMRNKKI
jgi:hypothetical protein